VDLLIAKLPNRCGCQGAKRVVGAAVGRASCPCGTRSASAWTNAAALAGEPLSHRERGRGEGTAGDVAPSARPLSLVMPGLAPGIHAVKQRPWSGIARSEATKQSSISACTTAGLLRSARNDDHDRISVPKPAFGASRQRAPSTSRKRPVSAAEGLSRSGSAL
jgi:hypothetical protein